MKTCRIGVIGAGRIGKLHAENIKRLIPEFDLQAIADPNLDKKWAESLSIARSSYKAEDVLFDEDLDAVLIASPSDLHVQHIKAASESGKAIFCEKPLGLTEDEIKDALAVIHTNNSILQIGFNRRFDPSFATLQQQVQNGSIGTVHIVKITSRDPQCPSKDYCARSGGIFMDMSIHDFDMARFLTQSEVVEVYASGAVLINPDFEQYHDVDTAIIQLRFANGALGVIDNSRQAIYGYDQRIEVFGSEGMLLADNQKVNSVTHYSKKNNANSNPLYFFLERYQQAYILQMQAFYKTWAGQSASLVSGTDGLQALRIAKAAKKSMETRTPVSIL